MYSSYTFGEEEVGLVLDINTGYRGTSLGTYDSEYVNNSRMIIGLGKTVLQDGKIVGLIGTLGVKNIAATQPDATTRSQIVFGPKVFVSFGDKSFFSLALNYSLKNNYSLIDLNLGRIRLGNKWVNDLEFCTEYNSDAFQYKAETSFLYQIGNGEVGVTAGCGNMGSINLPSTLATTTASGYLAATIRMHLRSN